MPEEIAPAEELLSIAEQLYAGPAEEFTQARNAAAKKVADKALAKQVTALKKPSVAAWAVNLLVRVETEQIDSVLSLAESLRAAAEALDGDELRALTRQRRQLTSALATSARSHARDAGIRLTSAVIDQVEGMLTAAMLDPVAAQVVRTGRVVTAFTATGVSDLAVAAVVAVPDALDVAALARAADDEEPRVPDLRVVPDNGARLEAAEDALEEATVRVSEAQALVAEAEESIETLNARRLQLQGEADELRRRLASIEEDVEEVDDELEEAEEVRIDATQDLAALRQTKDEAQEKLDRLRG
jgi:hypothetical protein